MRCLLKLHVAIDGVSACVVVMGQGGGKAPTGLY